MRDYTISGRGPRVSAIPDRSRPPILSPRQWETLRHRALGLTAWQTAIAMNVAEQSVKNNLNDVYRRLDVSCLQDALRAVGWLRVPEA